ncbi:MAG: hypothetical protein RMK97_00100 [Sutterellaceae bacterium]|nr:hypothetical protein [Burkholderiaceae bacterium]MDW8428903.1 hypothetical protein [Sutterellaceae bacterium]
MATPTVDSLINFEVRLPIDGNRNGKRVTTDKGEHGSVLNYNEMTNVWGIGWPERIIVGGGFGGGLWRHSANALALRLSP